MPSPHTLGSIMHQPLAALTPLLLFPLENRTSTHPPSTPVNPPHPTGRPSRCVTLLDHPRTSSLLAIISLAFVCQSSTAGTISPSPATFAILRILSPFCTEGRLSSHLARTISATPSRRRSSSRRFCLSHSLFPFSPFLSCSSPLPCPHFSLAHSSRRGWSRLCRDFRLFFLLAPHLPPPPSQRSSSFGVRTLFVASPLLFVLLQPTSFIPAVLYPLHERAHSSTYTGTHTLSHTHTETPFVRLLLANYLPRSFFTLSQPCLCLSVSTFRSSSSASLLSHHCPENPPFPNTPNLPPGETGFRHPRRSSFPSLL